jgi:hypothetical protein
VFAATEKMKGLWMPIAAFKADNVAKGVVDASLQEGLAANMFKGVYKAQVRLLLFVWGLRVLGGDGGGCGIGAGGYVLGGEADQPGDNHRCDVPPLFRRVH